MKKKTELNMQEKQMFTLEMVATFDEKFTL